MILSKVSIILSHSFFRFEFVTVLFSDMNMFSFCLINVKKIFLGTRCVTGTSLLGTPFLKYFNNLHLATIVLFLGDCFVVGVISMRLNNSKRLNQKI